MRATSTDQVRFPAGLKWEPMREVRFQDPPKPGAKPLSKEHAAALAVWSDEVKRSFDQAPAFSVGVLLAQARSARNTVLTFSLLSVMDFDRCEPPLNGKNVVDMFSKCLARVHVGHTPQPVMKEFAGFCYLHIDNNPDTYGGTSSVNQLDLKASWKFAKQWEWGFGINNVANRPSWQAHTMPQRSVQTELRWSL